jgi:hypothetical protein
MEHWLHYGHPARIMTRVSWQVKMGNWILRTVPLTSPEADRTLRGERENGQLIPIFRGVSLTSSSGFSSSGPGGREKIRGKEDVLDFSQLSETTEVLLRSDWEGELATSRDSLTRWLNSFTERVTFRGLVMEGGGKE